MRFLSVCSGIEAASVAWAPLGWQAVAFSEIERFPCAVLAHHYPHVPNRGDMTAFEDWPDDAIDLLCGGTPCQSFSVAGLRAGLDDPRGNLMLTYGALAAKHRPRWLVWENVPGVLSSNGGRDFGSFLGLLGQLGYGFAYRVLDAQYFGVPQRRRRVFVVACLGDWRAAAAVLFERHSLSGHPAPRRETGEKPAGTLSARTEGGGGLGTDFELGGGLIPEVVGALTAAHGPSGHGGSGLATDQGAGAGHILAYGGNNTAGPIDVATALNACNTASGRMDFATETFIAHSLRADGFDASEDGTGRGTPLVPVFVPSEDLSPTLMAGSANPQAHGKKNGTDREALVVAFTAKDYGADAGEISPTLRAGGHTGSHANAGVMPAVAFQERGREGGRSLEVGGDLAFALLAPAGGGRAQERNVAAGMQVRRLTPRECERLQGFPDDYTLIPGKAARQMEADMLAYLRATRPDLSEAEAQRLAADGPRYKALGNSWAVPCARWIGERIAAVDALGLDQPASNLEAA